MFVLVAHSKTHFTLSFVATLLVIVTGCGESTFTGKTKHKEADLTASGIQWLMTCDGLEVPAPEASETQIILQGEGPHKLDQAAVDGTTVLLSGNVCTGDSRGRNIVFVIDVSGSMVQSGGNDIPKNGTCGRYEAVKNVLASAAASESEARFALVTFADSIRDVSSGFFKTENELFGDLSAGGADAFDILCGGGGGTNYSLALKAGRNLFLANTDQGFANEMYFLSDGAPEDNAEGKAEAALVKQDSTIATIMLGAGNDSILRDYIASRDERGQPLHSRVAQSSELADALTQLTQNKIEEATFSYRPIGKEDWQSLDVRDKIQSKTFGFEAFSIDASSAPDGLEIDLSYRDRFGNEQKNQGKITWDND
jgi:uncharacterized protein YegL